MAKRPTLRDLAQEAGLSISTVDRAINSREAVREETLRKIVLAAERIGYHAHSLLRHRVAENLREYRLGFILIKERHEYYRNFAREIEIAARNRSDARIRVVIRYADSQSPEEFAGLLLGLRGKVDAIAAAAVSHPRLTWAVQELAASGIPVYALLNDFAQGHRQAYLGLNNMKIGRMAAWALTRMLQAPGKLGIFVGGTLWHGHALRETGFRSYLREARSEFGVLDTMVNLETPEFTHEVMADLLHRHPDLRGLYVAGGGMEGAISALRASRAPGEVSMIVNETTQESRAALMDGYAIMLIATPLAALCQRLIGMMMAASDRSEHGEGTQIFFDPQIILPEML